MSGFLGPRPSRAGRHTQPHPCLLHRVTRGLLERRETSGGPAPQDPSAPEDET